MLRGAEGRGGAWIAFVVLALVAALPIAACGDDGVTPDCSTPDAGCGTDFTPTNDEGGDALEAAPSEAAPPNDAASADTGPGDASSDADAHD